MKSIEKQRWSRRIEKRSAEERRSECQIVRDKGEIKKKAHKEKHREIRFWGYVPGLVPALRAKSRNLRLKMTMLHT